ncbi:hypothetical protein TSOC_002347 [Tetrabaena socialis]|uniref:Uncharacterized protein n=1 Tax=Tetrabaena socialis TaxID=47790 RepID=A0A2J8AEB8_9CHLO|nr:hypothetical protein TSOC_002347 [Tetrabaena socialis]|eukprot:PNH10846.1 hypothetical protein TSOC_002347 [Tetrabaena socialis]
MASLVGTLRSLRPCAGQNGPSLLPKIRTCHRRSRQSRQSPAVCKAMSAPSPAPRRPEAPATSRGLADVAYTMASVGLAAYIALVVVLKKNHFLLHSTLDWTAFYKVATVGDAHAMTALVGFLVISILRFANQFDALDQKFEDLKKELKRPWWRQWQQSAS